MNNTSAMERFAPTILHVYHRDKEAFWAAVLAPFLSDSNSFLARLRHLGVDLRLLSAFKGLDEAAQKVLREFGETYNVDVTRWESNRTQYFRDAYPIFAFLAVWMDEAGLQDLLDDFDKILQAGVFAVSGYGILDANVDSSSPSPVEILAAMALISEYENRALRIFGVSQVNLEIMQRMRSLFLGAEIKEKATRGISSPYTLDNPEHLGTKGANSVTPFMLSLERLGKTDLINDYWEVFLLFGAAIQMMDDWIDLEGDLAAGHYSYVTLGITQLNEGGDPEELAKRLRGDSERVRETYSTSKEMLDKSREILIRLDEPVLMKLVDVTEARVDSYFRKELGMS